MEATHIEMVDEEEKFDVVQIRFKNGNEEHTFATQFHILRWVCDAVERNA